MAVRVPYRVKLPEWVFDCVDLEASAEVYIERNYPERYFIRVEEGFAVCEIL